MATPKATTHYMFRLGSLPGSLVKINDSKIPELLAGDGWRLCEPGKLIRKEFACPVNGDGFRYWAQEMLVGGEVVGVVKRYDLGTEEL